jgi:acyl-CoA synthetase (AMP-forming)/AMP-acid ligase II
MPRVSDYVTWFATHTPQAEALILDDIRITYADLDRRVDALAKALIAAGVVRGERVATLAPPSPDYFVAFLAAAAIGAIWIGLNPRYQLDELCYVTGDCTPVALLARTRIGRRDNRGMLSRLIERTPSFETYVALDVGADARVPNAVSSDDFLTAGRHVSAQALARARADSGGRHPCMIVYTSGSTGKPKGAMLHHEGVIDFSLRQNRVWPVSPHRTLNYFPINHIGCVVDLSVPTLVAGGTIVFLEQFSPRASLELMDSERITLWGSVPSVFQLQLGEPDFASFNLSAVQLIVWGGAAMPRETIRRLLEFGQPLATNYGLTESGSAITVVPPTNDVDTLANTVGWPSEGVEVRLVDPNGQPGSDGEPGRIEARSSYNMLGYWGRPEATRETLLEDGWLATGDVGRRNTDGSYSIVGRVKEMYKSGGYNVYPREVEDAIEGHPAVAMAAVVGVEDPLWQEVGVAYVVPRGTLTPERVEAHCRERLANYKIPKLFVMIDELPLLPIGKVDKVALTRRATEDYARTR